MRRSKYKQKERQLKVGDTVLVVDENIARGKWNLFRVIEVYSRAKDGVDTEREIGSGRVQAIGVEVLSNHRRFFLMVNQKG